MSGPTVRDYVRSQRRVDVAWEPGRDVMSVRISRRDGTFRALAATALELERQRGGPIEIFRFLVRDDSLDQAAITLLAADRIRDLAGRPDPGPFDGYSRDFVPLGVDETLTVETLRRAVRQVEEVSTVRLETPRGPMELQAAFATGATSARNAAEAFRNYGLAASRPRPTSATEAELIARDFMRNLRGPVMPNPARRAVRGEIEEDAQVEKPEPLAPPNPDLPFYRMHR